jgi:hypothetical protein
MLTHVFRRKPTALGAEILVECLFSAVDGPGSRSQASGASAADGLRTDSSDNGEFSAYLDQRRFCLVPQTQILLKTNVMCSFKIDECLIRTWYKL